MHINYSTFQPKKVRKMQNLGNVYICGSPFVMSRTDAQAKNGIDMVCNDNEELHISKKRKLY